MSAASPPTNDSSSRIAVPPPPARDAEADLDGDWYVEAEIEITTDDSQTVPSPAPVMTGPVARAASPSATPPIGTQSLTATPATGVRTITCPACSGPVDVKSPHVAVYQGAVRVYCSAACLEARDPIPVPEPTVQPRKSRKVLWLVLGGFVVAGGVTAFFLQRELQELDAPPAPDVVAIHTPIETEVSASGDPQKEADIALVNELMHDAWIHPLAGPVRRMPHNHTGAFGAERAGDRPPECVSGHCGVDVGNNWGERVYAVHDGVIDFVNHGPNEERGGQFVRIAHRDGTLFSWYFHLAAIPRSLKPGDKVKAGQMIGLLGDTGVKHSEPHLHFALSVKTSKHVRERYLDPEPLIAIWPLWIPNESGGGSISMEEPGVPVRASGGSSHRKQKGGASDSEGTGATAVSPTPGPAPAESAPAAAPTAAPDTAPSGTNN